MMHTRAKELVCPNCSGPVNKVNIITMSHHLKYPYCSIIPNDDVFLYCKNPRCQLAYFSENTYYTKDQMQSIPQVLDNTICFCFGITEDTFLAELKAGNRDEFFSNLDQLAGNRKCVCKQKNPSGKGCLATFKRLYTEVCA
jgi:hypothetical protein